MLLFFVEEGNFHRSKAFREGPKTMIIKDNEIKEDENNAENIA